MKQKILTVFDVEELNDTVEYIISSMQFQYPNYNAEGNYILADLTDEERLNRIEKWLNDSKTNPFCFRENEQLRNITFAEALEMPLQNIKEFYLKEHLPMLRGILRKGTMNLGYIVSDDVPDSYLDDMFALWWRETLKITVI